MCKQMLRIKIKIGRNRYLFEPLLSQLQLIFCKNPRCCANRFICKLKSSKCCFSLNYFAFIVSFIYNTVILLKSFSVHVYVRTSNEINKLLNTIFDGMHGIRDCLADSIMVWQSHQRRRCFAASAFSDHLGLASACIYIHITIYVI